MPEKQRSIVLDVMGSDSGEACIIDGGLDAARRFGDSLRVILVGQQDVIEGILQEREDVPSNIDIEHAPDVVPMHMSATVGVRMRDSSVRRGLKLVREKKADGFVSPGNTGAVMATALLRLGRIEGVARPAITSLFPTWTGKQTVVLDVGANADCKPSHLSQFAVMGSVYCAIIHKQESPRVGLLSIGEERSKGNELIFNASELLRRAAINFVGNIEGRDILSGAVDVAVTDGFTGNIILKFAESVQPMLVKSMQRQVQTNIFSRAGAALLLPFLRRMKKRFDYAEAGGAPLLGVKGIVIIGHGSSNSKAVCNAIGVAREMADSNVLERIRTELATNHFGSLNGTKDKSEDHRNGVVCSDASPDERGSGEDS